MDRRERLIVWGTTALAFALRAAYVVHVQVPPYNDPAVWNEARLAILHGLPYPVGWTPLYPALLALVSKIFGEGYTILYLANSLFSALTAVFTYLCAKELFGRKTAYIALAFAAVYVDMIWYCGIMMGENLAILLFTVTVYRMLKDRHAALNGALFGLTCMAKGLFIIALPALAAWIWYKYRAEGWLKKALQFCALTILVLLPWNIWTTHRYKDVVVLEPTLGCTIFDGHNPYSTGGVDYLFLGHEYGAFYADSNLSVTEINRICMQKSIDFILHNPLQEFRLTALKISKQLVFSTSFVFYREAFPAKKTMYALSLLENMLLFPLCVLAMALTFRDKNAFGLSAIILVFLGVFVTLFSAEVRKRMPFVPFMLVLAAHGAAMLPGLAEKVRREGAGELRRPLITAAVITVLLYVNFVYKVATRYNDVLSRF